MTDSLSTLFYSAILPLLISGLVTFIGIDQQNKRWYLSTQAEMRTKDLVTIYDQFLTAHQRINDLAIIGFTDSEFRTEIFELLNRLEYLINKTKIWISEDSYVELAKSYGTLSHIKNQALIAQGKQPKLESKDWQSLGTVIDNLSKIISKELGSKNLSRFAKENS